VRERVCAQAATEARLGSATMTKVLWWLSGFAGSAFCPGAFVVDVAELYCVQ